MFWVRCLIDMVDNMNNWEDEKSPPRLVCQKVKHRRVRRTIRLPPGMVPTPTKQLRSREGLDICIKPLIELRHSALHFSPKLKFPERLGLSLLRLGLFGWRNCINICWPGGGLRHSRLHGGVLLGGRGAPFLLVGARTNASTKKKSVNMSERGCRKCKTRLGQK